MSGEENSKLLRNELAALRPQFGVSLTRLRRSPTLLELIIEHRSAPTTRDQAARLASILIGRACDRIVDVRQRDCLRASLNIDHVHRNLTVRREDAAVRWDRSPRQVENIEKEALRELELILTSLSSEDFDALSTPQGSNDEGRSAGIEYRQLSIESVVTVFNDGHQEFLDLIDVEFTADGVETITRHISPSPTDASTPAIQLEPMRGFKLEHQGLVGEVFELVWRLPRAFKSGERHTVAQRGQTPGPIKPNYVYVPDALPIDHLRIMLQFRDWLPQEVNVLDGVGAIALGSQLHHFGEPASSNGDGEYEYEFDQLRSGYVYGFAWN